MTEPEAGPQLWSSQTTLARRFSTVLCDLDGVVYVQGEPIPGAPAALDNLRECGGGPVFVTNNASRRAETVAELLRSRGTRASAQEVRTSAQVAAGLLRERLDPGSNVLVVGAKALAEEVADAGLTPLDDPSAGPVEAVVQGFGPDVGWRHLAGAVATVRDGAWWVATNTDRTVPSAAGPMPGNGSLVAVVATALGREPDAVAGKPSPRIISSAAASRPEGAPMMVGDRWDTDIAGAVAAGIPGVLVLSGSTTPDAVLRIPPGGRPRFLAWTLQGIHEPHPYVGCLPGSSVSTRCQDWTASDNDGRLTLSGRGQPLDALRALAEAAWAGYDRHGVDPVVEPSGPEATAVCRRLGVATG